MFSSLKLEIYSSDINIFEALNNWFLLKFNDLRLLMSTALRNINNESKEQ